MPLRFRPAAAGDDAAPETAEWLPGQARDLGVGGAFVATYRALPVGTELDVEVELPGSDGWVTARAQVRWLAEPERLPPGCEAGMGIAFAPLEADALLAVTEYLADASRVEAPA